MQKNLTVAYANCSAYYFDDKKQPMSKQLITNKSKIKNMSGVKTQIFYNKLYALVNENIVNLNQDYFTTSETDQWFTAINNFDAKAYYTALSKDTTQNATKFLEEEFKKLNVCLKKNRPADEKV